MPLQEKLGNSLSENLITLLGHSNEFGRIVCALLDVQLLEGHYRLIGERFTEYWRKYKQAPKLHAADLFDDILSDSNDRRGVVIRRMLKQMVQLNEGINAQYVLRQLELFTRQQSIKEAVLKSANILARPTETSLEEVEEIINDISHARSVNFDAGMRLDNIDRIEAHLEREGREFITGIKQLDAAGIVPMRGRVMLLVGGKGRGKSWWLVNCGRRALDLRHKVVHLTLENSEEETAVRYWQSIYSLPKRSQDSVSRTYFERNRRDEDQVVGFSEGEIKVEFDLSSDNRRIEMETRLIEHLGVKAENLRIKHFPSGELTLHQIDAYLDLLERVENFIPDMMIIDYPRLMKIDPKNARISIGQNLVGIRAIAQRRNLAAVVVDQLTRSGHRAAVGRSTDIGEDWSQVLTADMVLIHSMTDWEKEMGLGRLYVEHARSEEDQMALLVIHNYKIGQFCLDSTRMPGNYLTDMAQSDEPEYSDSEEERD